MVQHRLGGQPGQARALGAERHKGDAHPGGARRLAVGIGIANQKRVRLTSPPAS